MIGSEKEVNFLDQSLEWIVIPVTDFSDAVQEVNVQDLGAFNTRELPHELFDLIIRKGAIITSSNIFDKETNLKSQEPSIIIGISLFQNLHEFS